MRKRAAVFFLLLFIIVFASIPVNAEESPYFTFHTDKASVYANNEIKVKVNANENNLKENIAAFRITVNFDDSELVFKRAETSSQIQSGAFQYHAQDDTVTGIYACSGKSAPKLLGDCITFVFQVNEDVPSGTTPISIKIDQIVDWGLQKINTECSDELTVNILPPLSSNAKLASLEPLTGNLEPAFSPDITEYRLEVPYTVSSIEFTASAAEDGTVWLNRKTLGKAGTETVITATVTSADKKSKSQYFITVHRAEKEAESAAVSEIQSESTGKNSGKTQNSSDSERLHSETDNSSGSAQSQNQAIMAGTQNSSSSGTANTGNMPAYYGERNLYVIGNQMPAYVVGMLAACICMLAGPMILFFFRNSKELNKTKKPESDMHNDKEEEQNK